MSQCEGHRGLGFERADHSRLKRLSESLALELKGFFIRMTRLIELKLGLMDQPQLQPGEGFARLITQFGKQLDCPAVELLGLLKGVQEAGLIASRQQIFESFFGISGKVIVMSKQASVFSLSSGKKALQPNSNPTVEFATPLE